MPRHFILNSHYLPPPSISSNNTNEYVFISREKEISINENDFFIYSSGEKPVFEKKGIVLEKKQLRVLPLSKDDQRKSDALRKRGLRPLSQEIEWLLKIEIQSNLNKKQSFNDLIYSLLFVENYSNPIGHIQQKVRGIDKFDFDTIELGLIYIARTAFGKLMNALPIDNRYEMRQIFSDLKRREKRDKLGYLEITQILINYINDHFITQGHLLKGSKEILEKRLSNDLEKFGLIDFNYQTEKHFFAQANLFEPLLTKNILEILTKLFETVKKQAITEDRFEDKFSSRRLPISLN